MRIGLLCVSVPLYLFFGLACSDEVKRQSVSGADAGGDSASASPRDTGGDSQEGDTALDVLMDSETESETESEMDSEMDSETESETESETDAGAVDPKVKVFILAGQSNMVGAGTVTPNDAQVERNGGMGTLRFLVDDPASSEVYGHLVTEAGEWVERDDVYIVDLEQAGPLTVGYGSDRNHIGPELQFGHVMGDHLEAPVLLIKVSWGGKSLQTDFRPPSSGGELGPYYTLLVDRVHEVLENIEAQMPGYVGQGYEIVGFGWHQGWNDRVNQAANDEYQFNCVNFINDVRAEFDSPELPFVLALTGMSGWEEMHPRAISLMEAQLAVPADPRLNAGNVVAVETRGFWRDAELSPADQGYHWNRSGETMFLVGGGMGEAMRDLVSGE